MARQRLFLLRPLTSGLDRDLRETLVYALWRTPWRTRLDGLDARRMAARDLAMTMGRTGYRLERHPPMEPHGGLAQSQLS